MALLPITIATWDYDRVQAIRDGRIQVEGCTVNHLALPPEETFFRAFVNREFDVAELSLSSTMIQTARGECGYRAIPVFPSRQFRHNAIYIRTDRGIDRPEDLRGKVVGVPEYQVTAAMWVRGILDDEYGVAPADMRWRSGGIEEPGRHEKLAISLPAGVELAAIPAGKTLAGMLRDGEIDALVTPRAPSCFRQGAPHVGRLFPDFRATEKAYFQKTGIFPIMHIVGIRNELVEAHPWLPSSLYKAFVQAKAVALDNLEATAALKITLPWVVAEAEDTRQVMGDDFWPYGIAENRATLEAMVRHSWTQGLSARPLSVEELFLPSTHETVKI